MAPCHVIILGCGRSGTSIFGEFFETLPQYNYYCEPPFVDLLDYDYSRAVAVKVPTESPGYPPSPGLSIPINRLGSIVPAPSKVFWVVRHPLDAICSLRVGISKNWSHHPRPPDWLKWQRRPLLERCARHWLHINSVGFEQVRHLAEVVRFEAMVRQPREFAIRVCDQVGVTSSSCEESLSRWSSRVQDTNNADFIEAVCSRNHSRPDHTVRIGRWRENLQPDEAERIFSMVEVEAARFGYDFDD